MDTVSVGGLVFGKGPPKMCVPIVGKTHTGIVQAANEAAALPADFYEWRADWFEHAAEAEAVCRVLADVAAALDDAPLLFSLRRAGEGGQVDMPPESYVAVNTAAIRTGLAALVDVEFSAGGAAAAQLVEEARRAGVKSVLSYHSFAHTPPKEEMLAYLDEMQMLDADMLKLAVMPQNEQDVLLLLETTWEATQRHINCPLIGVAMGPLGLASRLCGGAFGSAATFAHGGTATAPGQLGAAQTRLVLDIFHGQNEM